VLEARQRLPALKPAERMALLLFGFGYSYREIGELNQWTRTKTDRCLKEGRAALKRTAAG
jgi:DNA-directed RNA polymerase specialized sigma24 family protein